MRFSAAQIAQATDGEVVGDADAVIDGVNIDSRIVGPGQLFVPIVAERDGHAFIGKAVEAGATVYLSSDPTTDVPGATVVRVADTALALADLGRAARTRLPARVVGVTGSVGKTSTKDLLAGVLATTYPTAASEKSFNNELGLPMTLVNAPDSTEAVVLEMGARGIGHIELLCGIGRPTVGVITRVEAVHLEMFGSLEAVAQAKGELIEALPDDGVAVLNADDPVVAAMAARTSAPVLTYGLAPTADVHASGVSLDSELRASFRLHTPWGEADVRLGARGAHQVPNALAAAAAGGGVGVPVEQIALGLRIAALSGLRMELTTTPSGVIVINDAYNANPTSMTAALNSLATLRAGRRVAVLGAMAELGDDSDAAHAGITRTAIELGVEVIAVDAPAYGDGARHVAGVDAAVAALADLADGDAVLVKASRAAALERVANRLVG
ncbi:UDP-N-acetylmuramoyl-tripeptide--D-alanyl-D-alanine ligase [Gordonia pseudamarae]|jgi:UDP-N-acetylmuramoyl-tripeptide--D-alanyl-D-alanine ligase|uniref:UDP-N-acetylmuramoyl-tripeptide--D-alanyl-D-alanine ligase n=1 Tax=Gordonia pseudamarae TaxID=2831662 RepID=A0ABX6IM54_9ACTN|nr:MULTISPECIES: UDP-N-acetylmuramoyl-tripeptide--D-alanyl-D-alanine ligase [Gordonia]MBD0023817.1 UDP-N-acetylmuramoyl-tripeptide--D-alanyl-D-alanine ligase [Gordonia sp. (in: high G+C Gram-positive bacteria)]QHN28121.1 UDP-N-acetylmuramoyl-tripeptide--D-alanyl-D-alanine ligase [Gordonia pseudamarae]QHN36984.1 UDP-N-acetylmuramoyl-tripeptide--D-alanyl-D-alanine ligase [Gordonia pseudamarae]